MIPFSTIQYYNPQHSPSEVQEQLLEDPLEEVEVLSAEHLTLNLEHTEGGPVKAILSAIFRLPSASTHQAWTGGLTSLKFHSYAGRAPSGFMYHSLVIRSSCFLANDGSTMASGMQWKAVSQLLTKASAQMNSHLRR